MELREAGVPRRLRMAHIILQVNIAEPQHSPAAPINSEIFTVVLLSGVLPVEGQAKVSGQVMK
jgi:hypothetical protein